MRNDDACASRELGGEHAADVMLGDCVQGRGHVVEDQDASCVCERAREAHALRLSTGHGRCGKGCEIPVGHVPDEPVCVCSPRRSIDLVD